MPDTQSAIIVGNWKMYKTNLEAESYINALLPKVSESHCRILLAVPFTAIQTCSDLTKDSSIQIGAQNMNNADEGAFTGEIAAKMLIDAGAEFVILGHSERRKYFDESNDFINLKVKKALKENLIPILCVGEDEKDRESGKTDDVVRCQLYESLEGLTEEDLAKVMVAYEPVWAIGTGHTATSAIAEEEHAVIRKMIKEKWGEAVAIKVPLLYGGSVRAENASRLMQKPNIDGLLVGGASLDPDSFSLIINYEHQEVVS